LVAIMAAPVAAGDWVNPPPFDLTQERVRDLEWDFLSPGNWQVPVTHIGPEWDGPGWECDEIRVEGLEHFYEDPTGSGRTGLIGIDNRNGDTSQTGKITFHVNNFDENPIKYYWDEAEYYNVGFEVVIPDDHEGAWEIKNPEDLPNGWMRDNADGWIKPNPYWEEFVWTFDVAPGEMAFLDNFRVATVCVPEPCSLTLWAVGVIGVLVCARRRPK
jgi:hypothetical protein